jgi:hypothetical protein
MTDQTDAPPNVHILTLEFGRFLSEDEWRDVVRQIRAHVPHVLRLTANAVALRDEQLLELSEYRNRSQNGQAAKHLHVSDSDRAKANSLDVPDGR